MHPVATGLLSESVGPRVGAARGRLAVQRLIREECVQLASVRDGRMVPISTVMHVPRPERGAACAFFVSLL
jgi:hypothetical protein